MSSPSALLIDIGNTRIKWGCWEGKQLTQTDSLNHKGTNFKSALDQQWSKVPKPSGIWAANVAGQFIGEQISNWALTHWQLPTQFAQTQPYQLGVINGYTTPAQLGIDRWLALIAARQQTKSPVCIIDCGSAITVDVMDEHGQHQGGFITPGWNTMTAAVEQAFSGVQLSDVGLGKSMSLGLNTTACVTQGNLAQIVAHLEKTVNHLKSDYPELLCLLTGGDAEILHHHLTFSCKLEPHLVLKGLGLVGEAL